MNKEEKLQAVQQIYPFTAQQVADQVGCTTNQVYEAINTGKLKEGYAKLPGLTMTRYFFDEVGLTTLKTIYTPKTPAIRFEGESAIISKSDLKMLLDMIKDTKTPTKKTRKRKVKKYKQKYTKYGYAKVDNPVTVTDFIKNNYDLNFELTREHSANIGTMVLYKFVNKYNLQPPKNENKVRVYDAEKDFKILDQCATTYFAGLKG